MMRKSQSTERQNKRNWGFKLWIDAQKNRKSSIARSLEKISVRIRKHDFHLHSTYTRCKSLIINGAGGGNRTLVNITSLDWGSCAARIKLSVDLADVSRHRE